MTMDGATRVHLPRPCPRPWRLGGCSGNCALDRSPWSCGGHKSSLSGSQACPALSHTKGQLLPRGSWVLQTSILSEEQKLRNKENKALALFKLGSLFQGRSSQIVFLSDFPCTVTCYHSDPEGAVAFPPLYKMVHLYFSLSPRKNCPSRISVPLPPA